MAHGLGDVGLGVEEILEESLVSPDDARVLVGVAVFVLLDGTSSAAEEAVEVGALAVLAALEE